MKTCPECAEEIKLEAKVCRYCGTTFSLVQVGYCTSCHKVTATSELGVCVICNSRLIDVHLESEEITGPTVGAGEKDSEKAPSGAVAFVPVVVPESREDPEEEEEEAEKPEEEPDEEEEGEEEEEEPEEDGDLAPTPLTSVGSEPDLASSPPPPPGLPAGVAWTKPAFTVEPPVEPEQPVAADETSEEQAPEEQAAGEEEQQPQATEPRSNDVAERLAAFGRRETPTPTLPVSPAAEPGPPVAPPPGPPATTPPVITPSAPVSSASAEQAAKAPAASPPPARVDLRPEVAKGEVEQTESAEAEAPLATEGQRMGIVPSLAHRIAHPLYQLAAIAVILVWLLEFYWDRSLRGTSDMGSSFLSHLAIATYGSGETILIAVQVAVVAAICGLLAPTRLLPKGWFRSRKVSEEFAQELKAKLGVTMLYRQKWYLQKMICAFAIWAIALAFFVMGIAGKDNLELKAGGYITSVALITGFVCSAVLMTRRTPVVAVDTDGRIGSAS